MKQLLTLNHKLNYSFTALLKFIWANIWKFIVWCFAVYLLPTYELIGVVLFLLIIDMITGIWKALKIGEPITARKLGETVTKMVLYMFGIVCAYVIEHNIAFEAIKVMLIFSTLISVREFKSIIENIERITGTKIWQFIVNQVTNLLPNKELDNKD